MSFTALTTTQVAPGQPVNGQLTGLIKTNFDDHQARITTLEGGGSTVYPPMIMSVNGPYYVMGATTDLVRDTINFNMQIIGGYIVLDSAGTAGTLQVDVKYLRPSVSLTTWTSIFTTQPSISYTAGNNATSTVATMNATNAALLAGDIIRLDTTSVQTGGRGFLVRLDFTKS